MFIYINSIYIKELEHSREAQAASLLAASKELESARRYGIIYIHIHIHLNLHVYVYLYIIYK